MRALVGLVALAGCGRLGFDASVAADGPPPVVAPPPRWTDGTRLVAVPIEADAGAALRFTWHDTLLDVDCDLFALPSGERRCIPQQISSGLRFSDAGCTQPVGEQLRGGESCGSQPSFAIDRDTGEIRAITGPYTGSVYQTPGACADATSQTMSLLAFYALGAPVDPSTFALVHEEATRSGTLSYLEWVFDDGARELRGEMIDHARGGVRCTWTEQEDGTLACRTDDPPEATLEYRDPACTQPVLRASDAPPADRYAYREGGFCAEHRYVVERGALVTGTTYVWDSGCVASSTSGAAYELGAPVEDVEPIAVRELAAGARIRELVYRTAEGVAVPDALFLFDTVTESRCRPVPLDGTPPTTVCAPLWTEWSRTAYRDSACMQSVSLVGSRCPDPVAGFHYPPAPFLGVTCDGIPFDVRLLDVPLPEAYEYVRGDCRAVDLGTTPLYQQSMTVETATDYVPMKQRR